MCWHNARPPRKHCVLCAWMATLVRPAGAGAGRHTWPVLMCHVRWLFEQSLHLLLLRCACSSVL